MGPGLRVAAHARARHGRDDARFQIDSADLVVFGVRDVEAAIHQRHALRVGKCGGLRRTIVVARFAATEHPSHHAVRLGLKDAMVPRIRDEQPAVIRRQ